MFGAGRERRVVFLTEITFGICVNFGMLLKKIKKIWFIETDKVILRIPDHIAPLVITFSFQSLPLLY